MTAVLQVVPPEGESSSMNLMMLQQGITVV
jgi:hypothetical protein